MKKIQTPIPVTSNPFISWPQGQLIFDGVLVKLRPKAVKKTLMPHPKYCSSCRGFPASTLVGSFSGRAVFGCQPQSASMTKKLTTYETGMAQPCRIHCPTDRDSGYILHNATPE